MTQDLQKTQQSLNLLCDTIKSKYGEQEISQVLDSQELLSQAKDWTKTDSELQKVTFVSILIFVLIFCQRRINLNHFKIG